MSKRRIIEALGEGHVLVPELVQRALGANDRVKYLLTLLQTARTAADGDPGAPSLADERMDVGIEDAALDGVVAASVREPDGPYSIPRAGKLAARALAEVETMLAPLRAAKVPAVEALGLRAADVASSLRIDDDQVSADDLARLTAAGAGVPDSLHLVVMDAHRELNRLQAQIATESIDGARAHDIDESDRALVRAFMRGLHRTEALRFDHPGLGTVATRTGPALVIQNDIGETDAHIVVARVVGRTLAITYTDVHLERLLFFQGLFADRDVRWEDTRSRRDAAMEDGLYHLATGRWEARDEAELESFLEYVGSRLVFLIDWNRARKRLRNLVGKRAAVKLLSWAAEHEYGHMAFLRAGADGLVYDAMEFAAGRSARAGESLDGALGAAQAQAYLKSMLRICSEELRGGRPLSLVQDEVRAELTVYLRSARQEMLELVELHAELVVELAEVARDALEQAVAGASGRCANLASRAADAEREADALVGQARAAVGRAPDLDALLDLVGTADDVGDCAEEATFYATLLRPGQPTGEVRVQARRIAQLVLAASREYLRAVQLSGEVKRGGPRQDMDAFLAAAHQAIALERETDVAQRAVHQALVAEFENTDVAWFVVVEMTRSFEEAADSLMHSAQLLRDQVLARVARSEAAARRPPETSSPPPPAPPAAHEHLYVLGDTPGPLPGPEAIGAKAHGLARMARAGLRVPEAAVLETSVSRGLSRERRRGLLVLAINALEAQTGLRLGSARRPLLLSVRSGAPVSMPGMLETVLNVGLCDVTARGLIALTGNPRLVWDSYRRLVESFATTVHDCAREPFAHALAESMTSMGVRRARQLHARALQELTRGHIELFAELTGKAFPQDPMDQIEAAAEAVLKSWDGPKARRYRELHSIDAELGTAVILQRMVFGNAGGVSGAGVGFTRDPALGDRRLYMDFLLDAQGEDIVAGRQAVDGVADLAAVAPDLLRQIERVCPRLEAEFGDALEFELTVQEGEVFLLQARRAKRTPWAALRIATDQVREGVISRDTALERMAEIDLDAIRRLRVLADDRADALCRAIPAGVGVASGPIALDASAAARAAERGTAPVLVRPDTTTEDIAGMAVAAGVLTAAGGRTSHAAVVARELSKPCLVGCADLRLDLDARTATIGERVLHEGDVICLDAESGFVYAGSPAVTEERPTAELAALASWAPS